MRMTAHNDVKARRGRIDVEIFHIVQHIQNGASGLHDCRRRQRRIRIDIALHREYGSDLAQSFQILHRSDIARMHDQVRAAQRFHGFCTQKPVRI